MIVLITCQDEKGRIVVSHGLDEYTRNVILPCETLDYFKLYCNAKYSASLGEWVLGDEYNRNCA